MCQLGGEMGEMGLEHHSPSGSGWRKDDLEGKLEAEFWVSEVYTLVVWTKQERGTSELCSLLTFLDRLWTEKESGEYLSLLFVVT